MAKTSGSKNNLNEILMGITSAINSVKQTSSFAEKHGQEYLLNLMANIEAMGGVTKGGEINREAAAMFYNGLAKAGLSSDPVIRKVWERFDLDAQQCALWYYLTTEWEKLWENKYHQPDNGGKDAELYNIWLKCRDEAFAKCGCTELLKLKPEEYYDRLLKAGAGKQGAIILTEYFFDVNWTDENEKAANQ